MKNVKYSSTRGFTLLEIGIVITIIGLLVGGIMGGMTLMRQSDILSVTSDTEKYFKAAYAFKEKYQYYPGDLPDATTLWGQVSAGCTSQLGTGTQTCNGNGDGRISDASSCGLTSEWEIPRAWQHLQLAGLISGTYTGAAGPLGTPRDTMPGVNAPLTKLPNVTFLFQTYDQPTGCAWSFPANRVNALDIGGRDTGNSGLPNLPVFTISEAITIDQKFDNGIPQSGKYLATGTLCVTSFDPSTATWRAASEDIVCGFKIIDKF